MIPLFSQVLAALSAPPAEVTRPRLRPTRQALGDPARADVYHHAVGLSADLQKVRIAEPGPAFHIEHLGQVGLLSGLVDHHHVAHLDVQETWPHRLRGEFFKPIRLACTTVSANRRWIHRLIEAARLDPVKQAIIEEDAARWRCGSPRLPALNEIKPAKRCAAKTPTLMCWSC